MQKMQVKMHLVEFAIHEFAKILNDLINNLNVTYMIFNWHFSQI